MKHPNHMKGFDEKRRQQEENLRIKAAVAKREADEAVAILNAKSSLEKMYGIQNHPKRQILWDLAWEQGHAGGFSDVENYYRELVVLIVPSISDVK